MASGSSTYNDSTSSFMAFIDVSKYFSGSTVTSESYRCSNRLLRYKYENPRISPKVFHNEKIKIQPFESKQSKNVGYIKQFIGHNFRIGNSKK